ncbi:MAG: FAD:protein FMN transferase [Bdellovibrionales bacterium]|nr:FAD:protein FMN transferase [Oligoflexia bacterium]
MMKTTKTLLMVYAAFACLLQTSCSSTKTVKKPERPWQKVTQSVYAEGAGYAFGIRFVIRIWGVEKSTPLTLQILNRAKAEIQRVAKMADATYARSEVSRINQVAFKESVTVSPELYAILNTCEQMYQFSDHKFDVTYVPYGVDGKNQLNTVTEWDKIPNSTAKSMRLFGSKNMLLDQNPMRVRLYNRRLKVNLKGMIRGYAIESALKVLANEKGLTGYAVIAEGLVGAAGTALQEPALLCIEHSSALGSCAERVVPNSTVGPFLLGASASLERRGDLFNPKDSWTYRSGGVVIAGKRGEWVQFAMTITSVMDDGQLKTFFTRAMNPLLTGIYFNSITGQEILGTLEPLAKVATDDVVVPSNASALPSPH